MSTQPRSDHDADPAGVPSAEQARAMLAEAGRHGRTAPTAGPAVLITYGVLCATASLGSIAMSLAAKVPPEPGFDAPLVALIATLAWCAVACVPILVTRGDRWRRGLAARWIVLMLLWGALWIASTLLVSTPAAQFLAPVFLVLFVTAVVGEADAAKKARAAAALTGVTQR